MKVLRTLLTASLLMLPVAVWAQDVKIDFDKAYDFSAGKTYAIQIGKAWGNDLSQRRVLTEFDEGIAAKGWKKATAAQANIIVILNGSTSTQHTASTFYSGMGGYGYRGFGGSGMATAQTVVDEYKIGTLVVDMFDAKTKNLVFRGTAEDEISDNAEKNAKKVEKASAKMFKNFPPVVPAKK